MNLEEYKGVYVFAQQVDNEISNQAAPAPWGDHYAVL